MKFKEENVLREIKFRAWNKVNKTMYEDAINNCKDTFDMILKHPQIYEIMQYTGLKDKDSVEIYEGDILGTKNFNYIVKWHNTYGAWYCEPVPKENQITTTKVLFELIEDWNCAVIGNICKNPQLLSA